MASEEQDGGTSPSQEIDFCTMGMFIIDEIHYHPPKPPVYDILGGGGSWSAVGARMFSPPPLSKTVSWIVDEGSDFPAPIRDQIASWETSCLIRSDPSRLTTRGWNGYDEHQNRAFKYTTTKLRLDENSLSEPLLFSKSFHLICSPARCIQLTNAILRRRKRVNPRAPKPIFIWEPVPDLCIPSELLNTTNALPYVDICSPNHHELATLMGDPDLGLDPATGEISTAAIERSCEQLLSSMPLQSYTLIVRAGPKGCFVAKNGGRSRRPSIIRKKRPANHARGGLTPEIDMMALFSGLINADGSVEREIVTVDPGIERWVPAYFQGDAQPIPDAALSISSSPLPSSDLEPQRSVVQRVHSTSDLNLDKMEIEETHRPHAVVDPTGGGNAFLGALSVGLARQKTILEATAWGSVAASFAIEQVGVPTVGVDEEGRETWNGVRVEERLEEFCKRTGLIGL
ncbi:hypothetical protein HYFRA_00009790 [Hymenoscyphus fraxineus]|uniref:Carbohydrate kinase PfkB domain-containing protein n=1 Tax=Hymenoscyphus fraxineus TaxID=746836 RepID=A0A9N9PSV9_9HELO|nr:hypothetical protein HYFRA_00009790 [Hymenoscyphus fraxineus]